MDSQSKTEIRKPIRAATLTKPQPNIALAPLIPEQTIEFDIFKRNVIACGPTHALAIGKFIYAAFEKYCHRK